MSYWLEKAHSTLRAPRIGMHVVLATGLLVPCQSAQAQGPPHEHAHASPEPESAEPPRVFLDKSPRIVWYQLDRLDDRRLLLVERRTDDPKYAPVYTAILIREGMPRQHRDEALRGLVELNHSNATTELIAALARLDADSRRDERTGRQLGAMLLSQQKNDLAAQQEALVAATASDHRLVRSAGYAGLIIAGQSEIAHGHAVRDPTRTLAWLAAIRLVAHSQLDPSVRGLVVDLLDDSHPATVRRAAIDTLATIPGHADETFQLVSPFISDRAFRASAVRALLAVPEPARNAQTAAELVGVLVEYAEATPPEDRTTDEFLEAMHLADQLLSSVPVDASRVYRQRLRTIAVRVVRIGTVEEEMRYDTAYFAVEAGRPVQIVLQNEDLMPHNLVVTRPGALQKVAAEGALLGPHPGFEGKVYVPDSDLVLFATNMVQAGQQERLTFTAPDEPGEYPYVCTFPLHWMRMYGVMVVTPDLDAWMQSPTAPQDPIGSNRSFVKAWTVDDFRNDLDAGLAGRSRDIGQHIFREATCALCHKVDGEGGGVGPELSDVFQRFQGDRIAILQEILDPSHRIEPEYAVHLIVTTAGQTLSGIVRHEDAVEVTLVVNPEASELTVIPRSEIEEIIKTSTSMMPKALLDRFTKDEIFELVAYLEAIGGQPTSSDSSAK